MGADKGIPVMADEAGAKAYVRSLSLSLHDEFESHGIHVTALPPAMGAAHVGRRERPLCAVATVSLGGDLCQIA